MITAPPFATFRALRIAHAARPALRLAAVAHRPPRVADMSTSAPVEHLRTVRHPGGIRMPWRMRDDSSADEAHGPAYVPYTDPKRQRKAFKSKQKRFKTSEEKFGDSPINFDIVEMLGEEKYHEMIENRLEFREGLTIGTNVECRIERLSAHGEGLGLAPSGDWVIAVPCVVPGELVKVQIRGNERLHSRAVLLRVIEKAQKTAPVERRDDLVKCKYFGKCAGCQYQHIDYGTQLTLKQDVVRRAFSNYAGLSESQIPGIGPTLASPLQYGYRTKLTPHFNLPHFVRHKPHLDAQRRDATSSESRDTFRDGPLEHGKRPLPVDATPSFAIGFDDLAMKKVMDIEECSIATRTINSALPAERKKIHETIHSYKNGATLLLRDSLNSFDSYAEDRLTLSDSEKGAIDPPQFDTEVVIDNKATVRERVKSTMFLSPANAFFQNNRSVLPPLLTYVEEAINTNLPAAESSERFLVDAYCGSGLFALCLAPLFKRVSGVEISAESIRFARHNAHINSISNADFLDGMAENIFRKIDFPRDQTTVIIDPPRRGCDTKFIEQLLALGPKLIVYVSCNVHTQARDVGMMVKGLKRMEPRSGALRALQSTMPRMAPRARYDIVSVCGADLFPQTHHVEGVCILKRRDDGENSSDEEQGQKQEQEELEK